MSYGRLLLRVELTALLCLVAYAAALTAALALGAAAFASGGQGWDEAARSFALVLWFSILPTAALFAPVYAAMHGRGWTNLPVAIVLGIAASAILVVLFRNGPMAIYALPSGAVVGAGTHLLMKWWARRGLRPPVATT